MPAHVHHCFFILKVFICFWNIFKHSLSHCFLFIYLLANVVQYVFFFFGSDVESYFFLLLPFHKRSRGFFSCLPFVIKNWYRKRWTELLEFSILFFVWFQLLGRLEGIVGIWKWGFENFWNQVRQLVLSLGAVHLRCPDFGQLRTGGRAGVKNRENLGRLKWTAHYYKASK